MMAYNSQQLPVNFQTEKLPAMLPKIIPVECVVKQFFLEAYNLYFFSVLILGGFRDTINRFDLRPGGFHALTTCQPATVTTISMFK